MNASGALTRTFIIACAFGCGARTPLDESEPAPNDVARHFALHFDGSQVAIVSDDDSLHLGGGTIEAWFRVQATPGAYQTILAKAFSNETDDSFAIWLQDGALLAGTNVTSPEGAVRISWKPDMSWHFVAWTFGSNGRQTLTLDGAAVASLTTAQTPNYDDHAVLLGADFGNAALTGQFVGDIDDVRIWSSVRSADQIASDMAAVTPEPAAGVVALWNFDEGSGQIAHDATTKHDMQLGEQAAPDEADPTWTASER